MEEKKKNNLITKLTRGNNAHAFRIDRYLLGYVAFMAVLQLSKRYQTLECSNQKF